MLNAPFPPRTCSRPQIRSTSPWMGRERLMEISRGSTTVIPLLNRISDFSPHSRISTPFHVSIALRSDLHNLLRGDGLSSAGERYPFISSRFAMCLLISLKLVAPSSSITIAPSLPQRLLPLRSRCSFPTTPSTPFPASASDCSFRLVRLLPPLYNFYSFPPRVQCSYLFKVRNGCPFLLT
jgi:hypothetical protein